MKTKILSLGLASAVLASCGVSIEFGGEANVSGKLRLPETVRSESLPSTKLAQASAVPGEYVVRLSSAASTQAIARQGIEVQPLNINGQPWALVKAASLTQARGLSGVEFAQPNYIYQKQEIVPNDPYAPPTVQNGQWYLDQDSNGIGADNAWERREEFRATVRVAVIDDGYTPHTDMPESAFDLTNPGCIQATGINCLDAVDRDPNPRYEPAQGEVASHGMAVAGIIGAQTNNAVGMAGVGYNVLKVVPIRVYSNTNQTTTAVLANAINTAVNRGVKAINLSLCLTDVVDNRSICYNPTQGGTDPLIDAAIQNADNQNVTVVASSGNYSSPWVAYPASNESVISVGATNRSKNRLNFTEQGQTFGSNYGPGLDMVAPGVDILTLQISKDPGGNYGLERGTSFSAPMVTASAGLLVSRNSTLTDEQVRQLLVGSGDVPADASIQNARFLRLDKALAADPREYQGKVRLIQGNTTVKDTGWKDFTTDPSALNYVFENVPTGTYTILAEVQQKGTGLLVFKCSNSLNINANVNRDLMVHYVDANRPCF